MEKMEEYADTNNVPIIGPIVGRFLYNMARATKSKNILEIGAAIGYSGIWFGRAATLEKGHVTTIERDPERVEIAKKNIADAGLDKTIKVVQGDALKVIRGLKDEYDLIFLDSDKNVYSAAFDLSIKLLRKGGLYIADNALWGGDVAKGGKGPETQQMIKFNKQVYEYPGMSTVIVPLRDGVLVSLKEK